MASKLLRRSGVSAGLVCDRIGYRPDTVVQVGIGLNHEEVNVLKAEWPECRFIGFEAHPGIASRVRESYPGEVIGEAVSNQVGDACLCEKLRHKDGSSLFQFDAGLSVSNILPVPTTTLDEGLSGGDGLGDVLLWLDCEGSELSALEGAGKFLQHVRVINIEMTPNPPSPTWPSTVEVHNYLESEGFLLQWIHTQRGTQYDAIYVRPRLFRQEYCCCPFTIQKCEKNNV